MPRKTLVLVACILGSGMAFLDGTVVNVALPALADDLDAGLALQQWAVEAYLLTLASFLLLGGSLADVFGRRRVYLAGVTGFAVTSALCGLAPDAETLVAFRALQGIAAAVLVPGTLGIIVATFGDAERGRAIGTWTAWTGVATVAGPLAGGVLVQAASWRWVFLINLPLALATAALTLHAMPDDRPAGRRPRLDARGAALAALGLAGPVFALIEQPRRGWDDPLVWAPLAAGLALLALFVAVERRTRDPMVPFELFRRRNFAAGNLATLAMYAGLGLPFFFLVLFLQQVARYGPVEAGVALLPATALMFLTSKRFGALADRVGARPLMTAGPLVAAGGLLLMLRLDTSVEYAGELLPALLVFGLGLSATVAPLTAAVLGGADREHAGIASGINNAVARVATLLAVAAIGVFAASRFEAGLHERVAVDRLSPAGRAAVKRAEERPLSAALPGAVRGPERAQLRDALGDASVEAFHVAVVAGAGLLVLAGLVAFAGVRDPRRRVPCEGCPGGALVGAPEDTALTEPRHLPARA